MDPLIDASFINLRSMTLKKHASMFAIWGATFSGGKIVGCNIKVTLLQRIYCHHLSLLNPSSVAVATDTNHVRLVDLRAGSSTHELRGT